MRFSARICDPTWLLDDCADSCKLEVKQWWFRGRCTAQSQIKKKNTKSLQTKPYNKIKAELSVASISEFTWKSRGLSGLVWNQSLLSEHPFRSWHNNDQREWSHSKGLRIATRLHQLKTHYAYSGCADFSTLAPKQLANQEPCLTDSVNCGSVKMMGFLW